MSVIIVHEICLYPLHVKCERLTINKILMNIGTFEQENILFFYFNIEKRKISQKKRVILSRISCFCPKYGTLMLGFLEKSEKRLYFNIVFIDFIEQR